MKGFCQGALIEDMAKALITLPEPSPSRRHVCVPARPFSAVAFRAPSECGNQHVVASEGPREERKEAVANLRALGDKRAIPALREAKRARAAGLLRRKANSNTCLRADAPEAVRYLETL